MCVIKGMLESFYISRPIPTHLTGFWRWWSNTTTTPKQPREGHVCRNILARRHLSFNQKRWDTPDTSMMADTRQGLARDVFLFQTSLNPAQCSKDDNDDRRWHCQICETENGSENMNMCTDIHGEWNRGLSLYLILMFAQSVHPCL